jgi:hypothetical protein
MHVGYIVMKALCTINIQEGGGRRGEGREEEGSSFIEALIESLLCQTM